MCEGQVPFYIQYKIIGQFDGAWTIQAFDNKDKPLSVRLIVRTPGEAFKMWLLLNGYSYVEPTLDETTEVICEQPNKAA